MASRGLSIPGSVRLRVRARDVDRCVICRMAARDLHHRRSRSVVDGHTHCPCNLLVLCGPGNNNGDHGWTHSNPFEARAKGFIVSRHSALLPYQIPVLSTGAGWVLLDCDGTYTKTDSPEWAFRSETGGDG